MTVDHHSLLRRDPYISLFWRLFLPNAGVLGAASALLVLAPPNGRVPTILGGFVVLLAVNVALMRYAFAPLTRLTDLARRVDPLRPGQRLPLDGPNSEVRVLTESFNDMLSRVEAERRDSARRALAAEQEQRRQIARDLHDELGQDLTAIRLQVAALDGAGELTGQLDQALASLRRIARQLRPEALDDLGLPAALTAMCEGFGERTRIEVDARISRTLPPLSVEEELVLYRIAQESLTNVVRHAEVETASLTLEEKEGCVVLRVEDDGRGLPGDAIEGQGIRGMRERALLVDADLTIERAPNGGTEVRLAMPAATRP